MRRLGLGHDHRGLALVVHRRDRSTIVTVPSTGIGRCSVTACWPWTSIAGLNVPILEKTPSRRDPPASRSTTGNVGNTCCGDAVGVLGGERQLVGAGADADRVEQGVLAGPADLDRSLSVPTASGFRGISSLLLCGAADPAARYPGGRPSRRWGGRRRAARRRRHRAASGRRPDRSLGPRCQPSAMARNWPDASNTRPVTPADSSDASHVTIGAIQCGRAGLALLVGLRRRAEALGHAGEGDGSDGVDGDAVARHLEGGDDREGGDAGLGRAVVGLPGVAVDARHRRRVDDPPADRLRPPWPAPASRRRPSATARTCP